MAQEPETREIPDIERRQVAMPVELRVEARGKGKRLVGYFAVFNSITDIGWFREQIAPGAFADTITEDDVRGLFNHDSNMILGRNVAKTMSLKEDSKGGWFEIDVPDTQIGRDVLTSVERGDVSGCSFAFRTLADEWDYSDEDSPLRTLKKVQLFDVGPVTYPAYVDTSVAARSLEAAKAARTPEKAPPEGQIEAKTGEKPPESVETPPETIDEERKRAIERGYRKAERIIHRNKQADA